jgi:hypothetical protein
MIKEPSKIKLLIKYYNYSPNNNFIEKISNNDLNPNTSSGSTNIMNQNNNSIITNNNKISSKININQSNINKNKGNINIIKELEQDYLIYFQNNYNYNNLENSFPPKIINIKTFIYLYLTEKRKLNVTLDSLILFKYSQNKYHILNDDEVFYPKNNNNNTSNENNISNSTILYYSICNDKIKVIVDLYSKSIDNIKISVSKMCSLLLLKYIILLKLREIEEKKDVSNFDKINNESFNIFHSSKINLITIEDIEKKHKIYGNGIMKDDLTNYIVKNETNRNFSSNKTIAEVYNYYIKTSDKIIDWENINCIRYDDNSSSKNEGVLNFILMEHKDKKCHLGLDFRFTILQYFQPLSKEEIEDDDKLEVINFYNNNFYQIKSGLNLYFNCLNDNCKYKKELFILNIGYGTFDIFSIIRHNSLCPSCNKKTYYYNNKECYAGYSRKNNLELKYLGMMNAKWSYKGYLEGIKMTVVDGKGITVMNDLLYKTKEFNFLRQFKKLLFQIEQYYSKNYYFKNDNNSISDEKINSIDENIKSNETKNENIFEKDNKINENTNKIKEIQITNHNNNNQKKNDQFIKFKNENNQIEDSYLEKNNFNFNSIKSKQNFFKKNSSIKQTYPGNNKRYSQNIENFENNNTNIDFNIIIDKPNNNCCENCFEYDQISRVCSIF